MPQLVSRLLPSDLSSNTDFNLLLKLNNDQLAAILKLYSINPSKVKLVVKNNKVDSIKIGEKSYNVTSLVESNIDLYSSLSIDQNDKAGESNSTTNINSCVRLGSMNYKLNVINFKPTSTQGDDDQLSKLNTKFQLVEYLSNSENDISIDSVKSKFSDCDAAALESIYNELIEIKTNKLKLSYVSSIKPNNFEYTEELNDYLDSLGYSENHPMRLMIVNDQSKLEFKPKDYYKKADNESPDSLKAGTIKNTESESPKIKEEEKIIKSETPKEKSSSSSPKDIQSSTTTEKKAILPPKSNEPVGLGLSYSTPALKKEAKDVTPISTTTSTSSTIVSAERRKAKKTLTSLNSGTLQPLNYPTLKPIAKTKKQHRAVSSAPELKPMTSSRASSLTPNTPSLKAELQQSKAQSLEPESKPTTVTKKSKLMTNKTRMKPSSVESAVVISSSSSSPRSSTSVSPPSEARQQPSVFNSNSSDNEENAADSDDNELLIVNKRKKRTISEISTTSTTSTTSTASSTMSFSSGVRKRSKSSPLSSYDEEDGEGYHNGSDSKGNELPSGQTTTATTKKHRLSSSSPSLSSIAIDPGTIKRRRASPPHLEPQLTSLPNKPTSPQKKSTSTVSSPVVIQEPELKPIRKSLPKGPRRMISPTMSTSGGNAVASPASTLSPVLTNAESNEVRAMIVKFQSTYKSYYRLYNELTPGKNSPNGNSTKLKKERNDKLKKLSAMHNDLNYWKWRLDQYQ